MASLRLVSGVGKGRVGLRCPDERRRRGLHSRWAAEASRRDRGSSLGSVMAMGLLSARRGRAVQRSFRRNRF